MRDDFPQSVKRAVCDRVAGKCSFPGCPEITIGPGKSNDKHVVRLGVAAHITAASPGGPRYDPDLTLAERSNIKNAIWLCDKHGQLIDKDYTEYAAETLRQWKAQAELKVYQKLVGVDISDDHLTTLISIGASIICEAKWKSIVANTWTFEISNFIEGTWDDLVAYAMNFNTISQLNQYLIFERQGDGRILDKIELSNKENRTEIIFTVKDKFPCTDPHDCGTDIDANFSFEDGDFKLVKGIDAARQAILLTLGSVFGDWIEDPTTGSYFIRHYKTYKDRPELLNRMLKIEITRQLSIPVQGGYPPTFQPHFPFIKRLLSISVNKIDPDKEFVAFMLKGEWGNGENFAEVFDVFMGERKMDFDW